MGFELTQGAVFYIVVMLIVVFIGLAIIAKGNPLALLKQQQIAGVFEPGKLTIQGGSAAERTKVDCATAAYTLTLKDIAFEYGGKPGKSTDTLDFMIILNYNGVLFPGMDVNSGEVNKISCTPVSDTPGSTCPPQTMNFVLSGTTPAGKQSFYFTAWRWNPALRDAAQDSTNSMDKLLDTFSNYYVSSFQSNVDVDVKCNENFCTTLTASGVPSTNQCIICANSLQVWCTTDPPSTTDGQCSPTAQGCALLSPSYVRLIAKANQCPQATEIEGVCRDNNNKGCYWKGGSCDFCPTYTDCRQYDLNQCTQCPTAKANCKQGLFWSCEPVAP